MCDRWFTIALLASDLGKSGQDSLDNIVGLGNGIACEIAYDFGRDRTTAQLCSCLT